MTIAYLFIAILMAACFFGGFGIGLAFGEWRKTFGGLNETQRTNS